MENSDYILELLKEAGLVTEDQLDAAWQKVSEEDGQIDVIEALLKLELLDEQALTNLLAEQYGLETFDLSQYYIPDEVLEVIPHDFIKQNQVVPIQADDDSVTVAMCDPANLEAIDSLSYSLKKDIHIVLAPKSQVENAIKSRFSSLSDSVDSFLTGVNTTGIEQMEHISNPLEADTVDAEDDAPIIRLASMIIVEAFKQRASDIHLEPMEKRYRIRYRIDGVLREVEAPPKYLQLNLTSRFKIMAKMDITEKRIPLDGRIQVKLGGKDIDLRVSSIPTTHGESIVMRILDKASIQLDIPKLGFYQDDQQKINRIINYPDGIFLVTGPTGSGKTTSLYAFLNTINKPTRKIITVEDPVEYMLAGINQVQVNPAAKMTFAAALKAMLRQAPNIIMVGEIRDLETAEIAIQASLTGHLVFSTLHTNDAPSAITRLIDMGVQPFMVASSVRAAMAQRLVRRVCKNCAEPVEATDREIRSLGLDDNFLASATLMQGKGCSVCGGSGYKGRCGIYEIFLLSENVQELIFRKSEASVIREAARKSGMRTLREDALRKAANGTTTLAEVVSTTMGDKE
ncbi:MAG: type II secretion system protein GspE [Lentisphaerae bacterium]|nr:type II secretion system protein GspE [Lentisphaerota bacterium]